MEVEDDLSDKIKKSDESSSSEIQLPTPSRHVPIIKEPTKEELEEAFRQLTKEEKLNALFIDPTTLEDTNAVSDNDLISLFNKLNLRERENRLNPLYLAQKLKNNPQFDDPLLEGVDFYPNYGDGQPLVHMENSGELNIIQRNPWASLAIGGIVCLAIGGGGVAIYYNWYPPIPWTPINPIECNNTKYDFAFDWTVDFSNQNCDVEMNLFNTGNKTLTLNELVFKTPSSFNLSNLPNGTTVNQNGNEYTLTFAQPLVIKPSEKLSLGSALAPLPNNPETYAKSLITIPHDFTADSNGTKLTGGFLNRTTCPIQNPIGQMFAVRMMPNDGALPTNANVDPRVNSFVMGYLYQFPNSDVVEAYDVTATNELNAAVQRYKEEHPNTNVTVEALLYDIDTLTTNSSKMEAFLDSLENAIDTAGGGKAVNGVILNSAQPATMTPDFEAQLVALHKAVKERFLLTHPSTNITISVPFNQTYSSKTATALNRYVDGVLVTNSRGSSEPGTKVADAMTNVPYTEQNINQEFSRDKIIQEQGIYNVFYHAEGKIDSNNVSNTKIGKPLMDPNLVQGVYPDCAIKNGIENTTDACTSSKVEPLRNASKYRNLGGGNSYNKVIANTDDDTLGIGTMDTTNIENIKPGDKVVTQFFYNGQTLNSNESFVSKLADRVQNTSTNSLLESGQPKTLTDSQGMSKLGIFAVGAVVVGGFVAGATYLYNRYYNTDEGTAKKDNESQNTETHDQDTVNNNDTTINMTKF